MQYIYMEIFLNFGYTVQILQLLLKREKYMLLKNEILHKEPQLNLMIIFTIKMKP